MKGSKIVAVIDTETWMAIKQEASRQDVAPDELIASWVESLLEFDPEGM